MITNIIVERLANEDREREIWRFWFNDTYESLVLSEYRAETRLSRRHKWDTCYLFDGTDKRYNTITIDDIPLPDDVEAEALKQFIARIKVVKETQ